VRCLNCGAVLEGRFCASCGQRSVGAYPTVGEMVGDAWQELVGYDGKFMRTLRRLVSPGALTVDTLEGRRARYISPVRLYLLASLAYFLIAPVVPNLRANEPVVMPDGRTVITIDGSGSGPNFTPEQREKMLEDLDRAPRFVQVFLRPFVLDPEGLQARFRQTFPRVLFALVPVFAAIVSLFYRGRNFPQHLVFAVHLHSAVFVTLTIRELAQMFGSTAILVTFESLAAIVIAGYSLTAFRRVYRESWPRVVAKGFGIAVIYCVAGTLALLGTMLWAGMSG
jgi:hypothetical protein